MNYSLLLSQLEALIEGETNSISILANATALLKEASGWFWVGFYMVNGDQLELGPFQGTPACFKIPYGKGVCGASWARGETIIVEDVEKFPGHIACSSLSRSEIVVPLRINGIIQGVLDIDSKDINTFTEEDAQGLKLFCDILSRNLS